MTHQPTPDQELLRALAYGAAALFVAVVLLLFATSCSSAWPQRCQTDIRSGVTCRCGPDGLRVVHHAVSGTATLECDGEPLPIDVDERGAP